MCGTGIDSPECLEGWTSRRGLNEEGAALPRREGRRGCRFEGDVYRAGSGRLESPGAGVQRLEVGGIGSYKVIEGRVRGAVPELVRVTTLTTEVELTAIEPKGNDLGEGEREREFSN